MKTPGSNHPISIEPAAGPVQVRFDGETVARSSRALVLREAAYPPVVYVPRADAEMRFFKPSAKQTHCPYKGDASYFTLESPRRRAADAVWSYEAPYPAVAAIKEHLAFYSQYVEMDGAG